MRQVLNVTDLAAFTTFLQLVAGRTASELRLSTLGRDAEVTHPTVRSWLSVREPHLSFDPRAVYGGDAP